MPTVIDSLIVQLGIDPSGFTDGQRKLDVNLRRMETDAQRAASNIERSGHGVVSFFRTIEHPFVSLRQHFERLATVTATPQRNLLNLAQQGRRTGQEVERGALAGAAGLRVMGAAGLTAIAAFMTLDKWRNDATKRADERFGVGAGAAGANLPIGDYSAISQALYRTGLVPEAETQEWLGSVRSAQIQAQRGSPEAANSLAVLLSKMNVTGDLSDVDVYKDSNTQILRAVAQQFHDVSEDAAIGLGKMAGWSKEFSLDLHNLGAAGFDAAVASAQHTAETKEELEAQRELALANARLDTSWQKLIWRIDANVDPALSRFDDWLASLLDTLSGVDPGAFALKNSEPNSPADAKPGFWRRAAEWLGFAMPIGDTSPRGSTSPGGGAAPTSSFTPPPSGSDVDTIRSAVAAAGGNEQTQAAFLSMFSPEDPGLNPSGTEHIAGSGGVGGVGGASYAQWTGSRRRQLEAFGWTGADPVKDRIAAAKMLQWELTTNKQFAAMVQQMNAAGSATDAAKIGGFAYEQGGGNANLFGYRGGETQAGLDAFHSGQASHWYSMIRSAQAAQAGGGSTTHATSNDVDINGGIHVYGADTSNGYRTGGAINDRIRSELLTAQINSGQE